MRIGRLLLGVIVTVAAVNSIDGDRVMIRALLLVVIGVAGTIMWAQEK